MRNYPSRRPCTECGVSTQAATFVCKPCLERGIEPLTGGRWVVRGLIQHWVPDEVAA